MNPYITFFTTWIIWTVSLLPSDAAFSSGRSSPPSFTLNDRFKATCPADMSAILQFDPSLIKEKQNQLDTNNMNVNDGKSVGHNSSSSSSSSSSTTWVAIYRSSNNLPSVLVKDEFRNAMRIATSVQTMSPTTQSTSTSMNDSFLSSNIETYASSASSSSSSSSSTDKSKGGPETKGIKARTPVAVAKLSPSTDFKGMWVIESMRCSLRKEDINEACDGNSEHAEAISICIDELILHHLQMGRDFDGMIRTKATIHQGRLLEDRGFQEVQELSRDMATHVSSLDGSLVKYAERAVETMSKSPGARDRALKILNYLGRQDPKEKQQDGKNGSDGNKNEDDDHGHDPWANIKRYL